MRIGSFVDFGNKDISVKELVEIFEELLKEAPNTRATVEDSTLWLYSEVPEDQEKLF